MAQRSFCERFMEEWRRLTPASVPQDASMLSAFRSSLREGTSYFFAPLRLLWWLVTKSWR